MTFPDETLQVKSPMITNAWDRRGGPGTGEEGFRRIVMARRAYEPSSVLGRRLGGSVGKDPELRNVPTSRAWHRRMPPGPITSLVEWGFWQIASSRTIVDRSHHLCRVVRAVLYWVQRNG
jgi:hypothetical protein